MGRTITVHPCLIIRCAAMNLSASEWFVVAGQGVAPCLQDYEPRVQLYTTPRVKHIVAFAAVDSKLD